MNKASTSDAVYSPGLRKSLAELLHHVRVKDETRQLLQDFPASKPREFFQLLMERRLYADAIRVLAMSLPKPAAVWWATLCAWDYYRDAPADARPDQETALKALNSTVAWVRNPIEKNRRVCNQVGRIAKPKTSAGAVALAAAWSSGSLSPPGLPVIEPGWFLTGKLTAGCVLLTAACKRPAELHHHYRRYLQFGCAVAEGKLLWPALSVAERTEAALAESEQPHPLESIRFKHQGDVDSTGAEREHRIDPAQPNEPAPSRHTLLAATRKQLAEQLQRIDEMLRSDQTV